MSTNSNLESYRFEDFVSDESFQRWILGTAHMSETKFWNEYYIAHDEQQKLMDQAKVSIQQLSKTESEIDVSHVEQAWNRLDQAIAEPKQQSRKMIWIGYAAVIVGLLIVGYLLVPSKTNSYVTYETNYGQVSNFTLPDGTEVTLNSNSRVKVKTGWEELATREVWLEQGEAFFDVAKLVGKKTFSVYANQVQVTVLGTEFNVNTTDTKTEVMLREGKISLNYEGLEREMSPGELATIMTTARSLSVKDVEVSRYDAWLDRKFVFDNTPLSEVAEEISNYYGVTVDLSSELNDKRLSGELPNRNLELLIKALKVTHNLEIEQKGHSITINRSRTKP